MKIAKNNLSTSSLKVSSESPKRLRDTKDGLMNILDFAAVTLTSCTILFFFIKNTEIEASRVKIRVKNRK